MYQIICNGILSHTMSTEKFQINKIPTPNISHEDQAILDKVAEETAGSEISLDLKALTKAQTNSNTDENLHPLTSTIYVVETPPAWPGPKKPEAVYPKPPTKTL